MPGDNPLNETNAPNRETRGQPNAREGKVADAIRPNSRPLIPKGTSRGGLLPGVKLDSNSDIADFMDVLGE